MNINTYKRVIKELAPTKKSILSLGRPGSGKSEAVAQVRKEMKLEGFIDLRLGLRDPSEVKGIIGIDVEKRESFQTLPDYFPSGQKTGILHLDELPQAQPLVQSAAYQLFQERKIGKFEIPEGWLIIASGNRKEDGGVNFKLPPALINRLIILNVSTELTEWLNYAMSKDIDPIITGFHTYYKGEFLYHDDKNLSNSSDLSSISTPRSWFTVNDILTSEYIYNDDVLLREILNGTISKTSVNKFTDYKNIVLNSISIDDILDGKFDAELVNSIPVEALYNSISTINTLLSTSDISDISFSIEVLGFIDMIENKSLKASFYNSIYNMPKKGRKLLTPSSKDKEGQKILNNIMAEVSSQIIQTM